MNMTEWISIVYMTNMVGVTTGGQSGVKQQTNKLSI